VITWLYKLSIKLSLYEISRRYLISVPNLRRLSIKPRRKPALAVHVFRCPSEPKYSGHITMDSRYTAVQDEESRPPSSRRNSRDATTDALLPAEAFDGSNAIEEDSQPLPSTKLSTEAQPRDPLPLVDIGYGTKFQCLLAISLGIASFLTCIICGIAFWSISNGPPAIHLPQGLPGEAISFIVNLILTQCLEGLAYVHSISLRWALLRENRLVFNTNIRLLTSSRLSRPNSWYMNAISATLLVLCYAATSLLVMPLVDSFEGTYSRTYVNLIALLSLGFALFGQTLLAIWCYYNNLRNIPSWSSNPLNTTVNMLKHQLVQHREGRCICSIQIPDSSEERPKLPRTRQPSQWQISTSARKATILTWILVGLSFIWFLIIVLVTRSNMKGAIDTVSILDGGDHPINSTWHFSLAWSPSVDPIVNSISPTTYFNAVFFSLDPGQEIGHEATMPFIAAVIVSLLFICAIQGLQTIGLHCAELIVNLSRDEDVWRALDAQGRSRCEIHQHVLSTPPYLAALMSWKYVMLVIFKSLLHWLLGQSLQPSFDYAVDQRGVFFTMSYARLFIYVICTIIFASTITFLTVTKPKGPQPATYGHIQTIADVIDDWTLDENGRFWWGDKGCKDGVRHAGMSSRRKDLGPIRMNALYAGDVSKKFTDGAKLSTNS
jgi:hypothetical protein